MPCIMISLRLRISLYWTYLIRAILIDSDRKKNGYISDEHFSEDSGYTNPEESEHDFFNVGHTSTSVSFSYGLG